MSRPKRSLFVALVVAGVLLAGISIYAIRGNVFDPLDGGRTPVQGQFVGQTRAAIEAKYGKPTDEWTGHYGNPPVSYAEQHSPAISTTYQRFGGTLYLSFEPRQGEWVCFSSDWLPNGCVF